MNDTLDYSDRGLDITIMPTQLVYDGDTDGFIVDIKYPCGELIDAYVNVQSVEACKRNAKIIIDNIFKEGKQKHQGCTDDYCNH